MTAIRKHDLCPRVLRQPALIGWARRRAAVIGALALALLPVCAGEAAKPKVSSGRYLFIVDTSYSMRGRADAVAKTAEELALSGLQGQMRPGDTLGVWTFNETLHAGRFPLQVWSPANREQVAAKVSDFLRKQRYEKKTRLDKVLAEALRLVGGSDALTLVLFTDGGEPVRGTPFDGELNAAFQQHRREQQQARMPFVAVLRGQQGRLVNYVVGQPQWPFTIPALPGAEKQPAKGQPTPEAKPAELAQAKPTLPESKPPAETRPPESPPAEPPAAVIQPPPEVPAPPLSPVAPPSAPSEAKPVPEQRAEAPTPAAVPVAPSEPAASAPAQPAVSAQTGVARAEAKPSADAPPLPAPEPAAAPPALTAPPEASPPKPAEPAVPPPQAVTPAPAAVAVKPVEPTVPELPSAETKTAPAISALPAPPPESIAEHTPSPASPHAAPPPAQTATAIPPPPFLSGARLLLLGLLLAAVAVALFLLIARRSRHAGRASLITQSFDRDKKP